MNGKSPTHVTVEQEGIPALDHKVVVCDRCLQAPCWHGIFMCEDAKSAGTREVTVVQLALLRREAPDYWFRDPSTGEVDEGAVDDTCMFDENALFDYLEASALPDLRDEA